MKADPKESESKAKTIADPLPNRLPMRGSALRATSGLCTEARCSISSPNHENAIIEIRAAFRPKADDLLPNKYSRSLRKRSLGLIGQQGESWALVWLHFSHAVLRRPLRAGRAQDGALFVTIGVML
jgi:hypothetical protein